MQQEEGSNWYLMLASYSAKPRRRHHLKSKSPASPLIAYIHILIHPDPSHTTRAISHRPFVPTTKVQAISIHMLVLGPMQVQLLLDLVLETLLPARLPIDSAVLTTTRERLRRQRLIRIGLALHQPICLLPRTGHRRIEVAALSREAGALLSGICTEAGTVGVRYSGVSCVLGVDNGGGGGGGGCGRRERVDGALVGQVCRSGFAVGVFEGGGC